MKQLSGNYSETELIKADSGHEENRRALRHRVELNGREWDETVQKLAAMFGDSPVAASVSPAKAATLTQIKTGVLSPLQEDEKRFYATAVLKKTDQRLKLATVSWLKESLELWLARAENQVVPKLRRRALAIRFQWYRKAPAVLITPGPRLLARQMVDTVTQQYGLAVK